MKKSIVLICLIAFISCKKEKPTDYFVVSYHAYGKVTPYTVNYVGENGADKSETVNTQVWDKVVLLTNIPNVSIAAKNIALNADDSLFMSVDAKGQHDQCSVKLSGNWSNCGATVVTR